MTPTSHRTIRTAAKAAVLGLVLPAVLQVAPAAALECSVVEGVLVCTDAAPVEEPTADPAPTCSIVEGVLVCTTDEPVAAATEEPTEEPAPVECAIVDGALLCGDDIPVEPAPAPTATPTTSTTTTTTEAPAAPTVVDGPGSLGSDAAAATIAPALSCPSVAITTATAIPFGCDAPTYVFQGDANGNLNGDLELTRAQAASVLIRLLDAAGLGSAATGTDHFADDNGSAHETNINRLVDLGLLRGKADGTFGSSDTLTGPQFATIVHRMLVLVGAEDAAAADHRAALDALAERNVTVNESGNVTRGHAADVLDSVLSLIVAG